MFGSWGSREGTPQSSFEDFQNVLEADTELASAVDSVAMGFLEVDGEGEPSGYDPELEDTEALEEVRGLLQERGCSVDTATLRRFIAKRIDPTGGFENAL